MDAETLLIESLDDKTSITSWNDQARSKLDLQLAGSYNYQLVDLLGERFLLIEPVEEGSLARMLGQKERIEAASGMPAAFCFRTLSLYKRKKLLENRAGFIDEEKELYLPFMALRIQLKEESENKPLNHAAQFAPGTQLLYLYLLYQPEQSYDMTALSQVLGISIMTAQRGLKDLQDKGLVTVTVGGKTGRLKTFRRIDQTLYYRKGKRFLSNPVKAELYVRSMPKGVKLLKSDLTALGEQTMLGKPERQTFAIDDKSAAAIDQSMLLSEDHAEDSNAVRIQVMKYNIAALTENDYVDPITLILSLSERDERIDMAVEELMEDKDWYME